MHFKMSTEWWSLGFNSSMLHIISNVPSKSNIQSEYTHLSRLLAESKCGDIDSSIYKTITMVVSLGWCILVPLSQVRVNFNPSMDNKLNDR